MNKSFRVGGAITANGGAIHTSQIKLLFDDTDNATYNGGEAPPAVEMFLHSIHVTADAGCEVQIGYTDAGKTAFTPTWGTMGTKVAGGGDERNWTRDMERPSLDFTAANIPALRIIVASDATVNIEGDVEMTRRNLL